MTKLQSSLIISLIILIFLGLAFFAGWKTYPHYRPCPTISHDTVFHYDTTTHWIHDTVPYYVQILDTVFAPDSIPIPVDTNQILKNYFATYVYNRHWTNDTLNVYLTDYITQNKPINNIFKYNIKIPFTTVINNVDNTISYNKYVSAGVSIPVYPYDNFKYISLDAQYHWAKGYIGVGYTPTIKTFSVRAGTTILKIK